MIHTQLPAGAQRIGIRAYLFIDGALAREWIQLRDGRWMEIN